MRVCVERCFPARGNLRLVAIGGSKLAREAVGARVAPTKGAKGREGETEREVARIQREDVRGESAQSASDGQKKRGTGRGEMRETRAGDGWSAGVIAAGVVRSGGHSITTQWRAYYVVSKRV